MAEVADDLFAGAGGWDLAAASLGIHARGIENMKEARATRDAAGLTTIHDDVWTYRPDGTATGLIASPPCQTFSKAGKGDGAKALSDVLRGIRDNYVDDIEHLRFLGMEVGDERTALVLTPLHFALTGGYEWLAWEQVDTVLPVWEVCAEMLRAHGWQVWTGLLHSEQYGVPQTRKRAFLLASRTAKFVSPPIATHSRYYSRKPDAQDYGVQDWVSMLVSNWDHHPPRRRVRRNPPPGLATRHGPSRPPMAGCRRAEIGRTDREGSRMTARDDWGDPIRPAEVCREDDLTDADRKSNRPHRSTPPKTAGGAPPKWADDPWGDR